MQELTSTSPRLLTSQSVYNGFVTFIPISLFVAVFGMAFGLAAAQQDIPQWASMLMSTTVFAGAAQFGVLGIWEANMSIFAIVFTVFAINARHLLIGATLYPHIRALPAPQRYGIMLVASDANWAMSMRAFAQGQHEKGIGIIFGGGLALWVFWLIGTWAGVAFGSLVQHPEMFGLDLVMGCFLLAMVLEGEKDSSTKWVWAGAALASILSYCYLPENTHVVAGAITGGLIAVFTRGEKQDD